MSKLLSAGVMVVEPDGCLLGEVDVFLLGEDVVPTPQAMSSLQISSQYAPGCLLHKIDGFFHQEKLVCQHNQ